MHNDANIPKDCMGISGEAADARNAAIVVKDVTNTAFDARLHVYISRACSDDPMPRTAFDCLNASV